MKSVLFIAWNDLAHQLRQPVTLVWLFLMPPIFFFFIGTINASFAPLGDQEKAVALALIAGQDTGFLQERFEVHLRTNGFEPSSGTGLGDAKPVRRLELPDGFTKSILAGSPTVLAFQSAADGLTQTHEQVRLQKAVHTLLADIVAVRAAGSEPRAADAFASLDAAPRPLVLAVESAGHGDQVPTGFAQAVPGMLVMFTLLVLLTSGTVLLIIERRQGVLRRLASAPVSRSAIVWGKWTARMGLAMIQIVFAMIVGTLAFAMAWGPDLVMVLLVLTAWASLCATAGLLLGSLATSEPQAIGLGLLVSNLLAALGGCWWPIEITPQWMQMLQKALPTGWTMDALHQLINFEAGWTATLPHLAALALATLALSWLTVKRFRYE